MTENMSPQQQIAATRLGLMPPADLAFIAIQRAVPWIRQAAEKPGALVHLGIRELPTDTGETRAVHLITVSKPGKVATIAVIPDGRGWRTQTWVTHPPISVCGS